MFLCAKGELGLNKYNIRQATELGIILTKSVLCASGFKTQTCKSQQSHSPN